MKLRNQKEFVIICFCVVISLTLGIITHDMFIGFFTLLTGLLCGYYAAIGKRIHYFFGLVNYILLAIVASKNYLYGIFFFYLFVFAPLQIQGFLAWKKNLNEQQNLAIRSFTFKNFRIVIVGCLVGSTLVGYLLNLLPGQQLAFIDATSNCINLCGMILMMLRFKESWWIWFLNNILDLFLSIHCVIQNGEHSIMMLATAIAFLFINILGIIQWNQVENKNV